MDSLTQLILAIAAIITAFLGAKPFWEWMKIKTQKEEKKAVRENYLAQMFYLKRIASKMKLIRKLDSVTRVIIFIGHNGGGLPRVSSRYYTSAVHWDVEPEYEVALHEYRNIEVDGTYIEMLIDAYNHDSILLRTTSMEDCKLKRYYQTEGVVESLVFFLELTDNNFIYMSISSHEPEGLTEKDKTNAELYAYSMRSIVSNSVSALQS